MKPTFLRFAGALLACIAIIPALHAEDGHENFGASKSMRETKLTRIENFEGESLGRIKDLGIDLANGRIVEVFVVSGEFLGIGGKIVSVPPRALHVDPTKPIYYLNTSLEAFKAAPSLKLSELPDNHRTDSVAAAYRRFGQEPYFLVSGESSNRLSTRPKVDLGSVHRSSRLLSMPVLNIQNEPLGTVSTVTYDLQAGILLTIVVKSAGFINTQTVIPATAVNFNAAGTGLVLDQSKLQFDAHPRTIVTDAAHGQDASSVEEPYKGERTSVALEQGTSYTDIDRTALISRELRTAKIRGLSVKVGTIEGRVTLRGSARSEADRLRAGTIAVTASRLEVVDNQIVVTPRS